MNNKNYKLSKNNSGSAIVTVLVIVAFVTILATAILYLALSNFRMKMTERKTEEIFYESETSLEEIKTNLTLFLSKSCEEAYIEILPVYAKTDADTRKSLFLSNAVDKIETNWKDKTSYTIGDSDDVRRGKIKAYLESCCNVKTGLTVDFTGEFDTTHASEGYFLLTGVVVEYVKDDYYSKITTDFIINYPSIEFSLENDTSVTDPTTHGRTELDYTEYVQYMNWKKE